MTFKRVARFRPPAGTLKGIANLACCDLAYEPGRTKSPISRAKLAMSAYQYSLAPLMPAKPCRLRRSTQHLLEVYSQGSGILRSFSVVDSSAARPGRAALANSQTGQCREGSIVVTADWCFRSSRAAKDSADRRSTP